jgi:hypothetical protein
MAAGCGSATTEPAGEAAPLQKLDLQVRNSGLHGGYLWLGVTGGAGRWHRFGQAELLCVTCPVPFSGSGPSYEIAVFDEQCQLHAREHTPGGSLQVAIELGPRITIVPAPPVIDWVPGDSPPIDAAEVPCATN